VCCFLIQLFETDRPEEIREDTIDFDDNPDFNEFLDDQFGTFEIIDYSFPASAILFNLDQLAYRLELNGFREFEATGFDEEEEGAEYAIGTLVQ
jgi:hypothetical protein